jgi:hypothetical protein
VVCWFLSSRGRREDTYTRMRSILREIDFPPPAALRKLAQITDFDLFVTTTFDQYLEQAINHERFQGAQSTEVIAYAPNRVADLPSRARAACSVPVVYPPARPLLRLAHYVISDEDTLEFVCALQSEHLTPGEALPRARAQPPARHRQQFLQLARAPLPAHGQAPAAFRPARRRRGARRTIHSDRRQR